MEITQVTQKSPSVWVLTLADGRSYEIDRTCVLEYALLNRLEIDDETLQEMQQTYCERHALQQALRWLNYRPYTFKAMFQRLMPIYGEATSFAVLKRLTENPALRENDFQRPAKGGSTPAFACQHAAIAPLPCLNLQP
jgi:hypothetical protein